MRAPKAEPEITLNSGARILAGVADWCEMLIARGHVLSFDAEAQLVITPPLDNPDLLAAIGACSHDVRLWLEAHA